MSQKVCEYMSDLEGNKFTENAPRPPVPGEENEQQSTHSSGSHKSHMSIKSQTSGKSGGAQNGDVGHSPAATPRRSNLDRTCTGGSLSCSVQGLDKCDDENAPLGFEPEGSAANSPPFTENSTPPCLKWATSLHHLLEDSEGVSLFSKFLENEAGGKQPLDFWYACQGLKKQSPNETQKINYLIKAINKKYIRGDSLSFISARTRKTITDQIESKCLQHSIFDVAQSEVEEYMTNNLYRLFLNSDFYVQYVERAGKSPKSSETSSGSNSVRPTSGPLPTLLEDQELNVSSSFEVPTLMGPPSSRFTSFSQPESKGSRRTETMSGYNAYSFRQPQSQPFAYSSHAPPSAVDSEVASMSSGALTDDTMSLTDSSVDGISTYKKQWKRAMNRRAQQNREGKDAPLVIPRTDRPQKDRNIAESDPQKFASLLISKLQMVLREREKEEKMEVSLRMCESEDTGDEFARASNSLLLMRSIEEDNAQSILEEHCSRIWDNSSHHTPSRSPGRHSPKSKSPERTLRKAPPANANTTFPGTSKSQQRKAKKENNNCVSMLSFDSGVGEEKRVHTVHHHHHHHHGTQGTGRATLEWAAQNRTMACWRGEQSQRASVASHSDFSQGMKTVSSGTGSIGPGGDASELSRRKESSRRGTSRKTSTDASSVFDSGISGVYEKEPVLPTPNPSAPNYDKVMGWMLASDSVTAPGGNHADSDHSSSHKWSLKATSSSPSPQPHKQGTSKSKPSGSSSGRSTSVERGAMSRVPPHDGVLPAQPCMQDPSMPLLTPPNTMTQLEEAKRRLETQARGKSKSFDGSREKRMPPQSSSGQPVRSSTLTRTVPTGLDLQSGNVTLPSVLPSEKRSSRKSVTPVLGNTSALASLPTQSMSQPASMSQSLCGETVIGIYFCGDPIPYRHTIPGTDITLGQFKQLISKKGNYRYYFKKNSDEFGSGAVFEEVGEDGLVLPLWEGKIVAKVERLD